MMAPGLYPISEISGLAWALPNGVVTVKAVDKLYQAGYMDKEYANMKVCLFAAGYGGDVIYTPDKPLNTLADIEGLKIWAPLETIAERIEALGAVPVSMGVMELEGALQKGVLDGRIGPKGINEEYMRCVTADGFGSVPKVVGMNKDTWNKLPADLQGLIDDMYLEWTIKVAEMYDQTNEKERANFFETGGQETQWSEEDLAEVGRRWAPLWEKFITEAEAKGLPMREAVDTFYHALTEQGVEDPTVGAYTPGG
jgi:TRAP-type C4-dicarboxylate transport system substrate-binding protein